MTHLFTANREVESKTNTRAPDLMLHYPRGRTALIAVVSNPNAQNYIPNREQNAYAVS
jgi:hypothetical protein